MADTVDGGPPVSREELLAGLSGRRASTSLWVLESRAGYLSFKARHAAAPAVCDQAVEDQQRAFLSAVAAGRELPRATTIHDLEQFAPELGYLVPASATVRADLIRRIGEKYAFRHADVPRLRAVLGIDEEPVRNAYLRRHDDDIGSIYRRSLSHGERLRWGWTRMVRRVDRLSPFWTSFGLTLTETVGAGILALPIAVAGVGPLPGIALIVLLGLVNVVTVAAVAETFTRTGRVRWGGAFFGAVVSEYLGRAGSAVLGPALAGFGGVALLAYYIGLGDVLSQGTGVASPIWVVVVFAVNIAFVLRRRLDATVVTALLVGAVNIVLVLLLVAIALPELDVDTLTTASLPWVGDEPFDVQALELVFGIVLLAFFGHTSVGNCARVVLHRDESGRALLRGTVSAMLTAVAVYSLWAFAVGGAVTADRLAGETGTALAPLAEVAGPVVLVVGTVFAVLAMGMASVQFALGLSNQAREWVPAAGAVPLVVVFVVAEVLLATDHASFTGTLSLIGTVTGPLIAGIFPLLLLQSSRRRGSYVPERPLRRLGGPVASVVIYLLFLVAVVAHAVIWQSAAERLLALATAAVVLAMTAIVLLRSDALQPLVTVEARRHQDIGRFWLRVTSAGTAVSTEVLPAGARSTSVDLSGSSVRQLRLWVHEVDPSGESTPLAASAVLRRPDGSSPLPVPANQVVAQIDAARTALDLRLDGGR